MRIGVYEFIVCALIALILAEGKTAQAKKEAAVQGIASWYSASDSDVNTRTASRETFNESLKTCASWHFKFGTRLKVTNRQNGRSVICRVNDRGPAKRLKRAIDLSRSPFREIADLKRGLIPVTIVPLY